jgi:hypothetical protein
MKYKETKHFTSKVFSYPEGKNLKGPRQEAVTGELQEEARRA